MNSLLNKSILLIFVFVNTIYQGHSQLSLEQMINITLGETFKESKDNIKAMFTKKAQITKADFFGAYRIEYENVPFDYYGDANYTFQYAKDTLVSIKVDFSYTANDTIKFRRLYNTLINDLKNDNSKKILSQYSDLNKINIFPYISKNCILNTEEDNKNYKPIKSKFLGQNFYSIYNSINTGKFLRLYVQVYERHVKKIENEKTTKYDGGVVEATLELTSEKFQNLKNKEEEMEISEYHNIQEQKEQIKLKSQNGIYLVPIKINNMLRLDFILDIGAADVSISPDLFMVLYRAGTINENDFIGTQTYEFADGNKAKSNVFIIKSIIIGNKEIKNVRASINNSLTAPLLLGQSALKKLDNYRIDNYNKLLIIE